MSYFFKFQVDFGVDIKLEGIQIFNRRDESTDNEVVSFAFTYGSEMTGKMSHSKVSCCFYPKHSTGNRQQTIFYL